MKDNSETMMQGAAPEKETIVYEIIPQEVYMGVEIYSIITDHPVGMSENRRSLEAEDIMRTMKILSSHFGEYGYKVQFEVK